MTKICTSLEQSKKLIELGIYIETADMHYSTWTILNEGEYILSPNQGETIEELQEDYGNQVIPAWSLSALLKIIPNVEIKSKVQNFDNKSWCISSHDDKDHNHIWVYNDELVDACVELISKLKE